MSELTIPALDTAWGVPLAQTDYKRDFRERDAEIQGRDSWKLERRQHFEEDDASRDALRRGDWEEALRILEEERADVRAMGEEDARRGSIFRRVRIVEEPLSPYMQWELHSLRLWDECGIPVHVVTANAVAPAEARGELPELVILGGHTMYQVLYTDTGVPDGGIRYTEPALVESWESYIEQLYEHGENIQSYFTRHVAHLPPPVPA
jgi:hypothetical protein